MNPPVVLALETATTDSAVAIADADGPIAHSAVSRGRRHVETLHPQIEALCAAAAVPLAAISAVAVDVGPGLFTGLRVGVTAAKALGTALGVPLVAVSSLQILAAAVERSGLAVAPAKVVPVVDMRRGEVAWSTPAGGPARVGAPGALARELAEWLVMEPAPVGPDWEVVLCGDGAVRAAEACIEELGRMPGARLRIAGPGYWAPPAAVLAAIAVERAIAGVVDDPAEVLPVYLRDADVAIGWESRHGRVLGTQGTGAA